MQCIRGVDGKGQSHGPGQSKALYSVRVLVGGGPELVGSMILGLWFGLLDEKVSGAEWS